MLGASIARADADSDRKALFEKVGPAVVQVRQEHSLGGGFVVDAEKGIIATNYHVIEGAKKITIFFPADDREMKHGLQADGYFAILPGKDLALVHVKLGDRKVTALKLAEKTPEQGDTVYTYGAPIGKLTIAPGMVMAVRTGQEVSDLMDRDGKGIYLKTLGYDLDAVWIQHSALMSHGGSGGPLVNGNGEVVGLSTMSALSGCNNNYAISAKHVRDLLAKAGKEVKAWSTLPLPRENLAPRDADRKAASEKPEYPPSATSDESATRKAILAKVLPAIVLIRHGKSLGSGCVMDAKEGTVATDYHVIEGAKKVMVFFIATDWAMKQGLVSDGYFAILPGKDLALIHVNLSDRKVDALKLAEQNPKSGETVYVVAPSSWSMFSQGTVSAIRTGAKSANLMDRWYDTGWEINGITNRRRCKEVYGTLLGLELNAVWIQHTAMIGGQGAGGPLVNHEGEVIGLNTMNLLIEGPPPTSFSISTKHLRDLMAKAGKEVKAWSTLPPPRPDPTAGDESRKKDVSKKGKTEETKQGTEKGSDRPGFRVWTNSTGNFHLRAKYVGRDGDDVTLEKPDGHVIRVPFSKLSEEDQSFIEEEENADKKNEHH